MTNDPSQPLTVEQPPPIPVAVNYFQGEGSAVLLKLVRTIGVLLVVIGAIGAAFYSVSFLTGSPVYRRTFGIPYIGDLYIIFMLVIFLGQVAANVMAIWGGILCLRRPLRGRRLVLGWAYASIALGLWSILYIGLFVLNRRLGRPLFLGFVGSALQVGQSAVFPIICLVFFHLREVRRMFHEGRSN